MDAVGKQNAISHRECSLVQIFLLQEEKTDSGGILISAMGLLCSFLKNEVLSYVTH